MIGAPTWSTRLRFDTARGVEQETKDAGEAYARFAEPEPTRYRDGWLPG